MVKASNWKSPLKVLLLSGGGFQGHTLVKELSNLPDCELHVFDCYADNITKYFVHSYNKVRLYSDPKFESEFLTYIKDNSISVIIPSSGIELKYLAQFKENSKADVLILVSDLELIKILSDKCQTHQFLVKNQLPVLPSILLEDLAENLPIIGKPINGWGGKGLQIIHTKTDLDKIEEKNNFLWQPLISHFKEVSIDFAINANGKCSWPVFRERIRTLGGFATISETVNDLKLDELYQKLADVLAKSGGVGYFNAQVLIADQCYYISDINPRIGTSAVMSDYLGNSLSLFLLQDLLPNKKEKGSQVYNGRIKCIRFLDEIFLSPLDITKIKAVVFDLDDTLIPHKQWILRKIKYLANSELVPKHLSGDFLRYAYLLLEECKAPQLIDLLCKRFSLEQDRLALIELYRGFQPNEIDLYPDSNYVVNKLAQSYKLGLITDNPIRTQKSKIDQLPFKELFHSIVYAEEDGCPKPSKESFNKMAMQLNVEPQQIVMIGDNLIRDIYGALSSDYAFAFHLQQEGSFYNFQNINQELYPIEHNKYARIKNLRFLLNYFS